MSIEQQKSHSKTILMVLGIVGVILATVLYFGVIRPQQQAGKHVSINGVYLPEAKEISDFQLTDNHGKSFTKNNLKGHWTMMFFGFTNCAMVCPMTMAALNDMYIKLQKNNIPDEKMPQVVMVSVDPDRDSVERMNEYVTSFNPNFVGTRTDIAPTVELEKELHIAAAKIQTDRSGKNNYTINHSAEILLFNPEGQLQAYLSYPHEPEQMMKDYMKIVNVTGTSPVLAKN